MNNSNEKYLMGIDLGTTGVKSVIYDLNGTEISKASKNTPTRYPRAGWLEQDAEVVIENVYATSKEAIEKSNLNPEDVAAVSFTHMCTTSVPVDKNGDFLHPIFIWQDTRGKEVIPEIKERLAKHGMTEEDDYEITGMPIASLYPYTKWLWFRKHEPELYSKTDKFITMQGLLTHAYTKEVYYEDKPDIAYQKIADANTYEYKKELADIYDLDLSLFPERKDPGTLAGHVPAEVSELTGLKEGTPVFVGTGDNRAATVGSGVAEDGEILVTIGTAAVACAYSSEPVRHADGKIQILGHATGDWQVEANANAGASSLRWFKNKFAQLEDAYADLTNDSVFNILGKLAAQSPAGANGVLFLPWLQGASTPRYDDNARGTFTGLSFSHEKSDIIRAVLEGVVYEIKTMLVEVEKTTGKPAEKYRITGGAANSDLWNQIQADIYGKPVETTKATEGAAIGAAMCAGIGLGVFDDFRDAIDNMVQVEKRYEPNSKNKEKYEKLFKLTQVAYDNMSGELFNSLADYQDKELE